MWNKNKWKERKRNSTEKKNKQGDSLKTNERDKLLTKLEY